MAIFDYDFRPYEEKRIGHIQRHFDSDRWGSFFSVDFFNDAKDVADYAYKYLRAFPDIYKGEKIEIQVNVGEVVGFNGVVCLDDLPKDCDLKYVNGNRSGCSYPVIGNVERMPTNKMVIVAGPLRKRKGLESGLHGFYTIFPGIWAPPLPASESRIRKRFSGNELKKAREKNKISAEFWKNHALIRDDY